MALEATAMVHLPDSYWAAAAEAAQRALDEAEHVLVPQEFLPLDERFAPLEFSWGLKGERELAWCCTKDDVHRLAPWLLEDATSAPYYTWSNEVFVLGANFRWKQRASAESVRHLAAWFEKVRRYRGGKPSRVPNDRPSAPVSRRAAEGAAERPRVLVVGASGMGNVGDDLIADVLADSLDDLGLDAYLSGPDVDPLHLKRYRAVVVGGGGIVYASRDGAYEAQNLSNYLKFGQMARQAGLPVALIGVGDQDHAAGIEKQALARAFARSTLAQFDAITTRDLRSSALLESYGAAEVRTGCDLLFARLNRVRNAVAPTIKQPARVALVGELYKYPAFVRGFADGAGRLASIASELDADVLVMSEDDLPHAARAQKALQKAGASAAVVDLRGRSVDELAFLFASYTSVVTTRFHGLVLAAMAGVPVMAFDIADGKSARLLTELGCKDQLLIEGDGDAAVERLCAALRAEQPPIPADAVDELANGTAVHAETLRTLLKGVAAAPTGPRSTGVPAPAVLSARAAFDEDEPLRLCWAASTSDTRGFANLGDSLSAVMVAGLADREVRHTSFSASGTKLVAVGSIGHAIKGGTAVVWGSGVSIRGGVLAHNATRTRFDVRAVRGRISAQHYRDFGIHVPDVYGDPVWFLPSLVTEPVEKRYELGVIPHIRDVSAHDPDAPPLPDSLRYVVDEADRDSVIVINTWHEPTWEGLLAKLRLIRSCKRIASQSFHGVVIAEAYGIPVLNFRYLIGAKNGALQVDLNQDCKTDPRVWEFYKGGRAQSFHMYSQRREQRTDWDAVIRAIDERWQPFDYDGAALAEAFPVRLAFDPLRGRAETLRHVEKLAF